MPCPLEPSENQDDDQLARYEALSPAGRALFAEFVNRCMIRPNVFSGRAFLETVQDCLRLAVQLDIDQALQRLEQEEESGRPGPR
jgi:hypothetical protein